MFFHNPLNRIQPKACALTDALGCKEWLKDARLNFRRNAGAAIANLNHDATIIPKGPDAKLTLAAHGVNRIVDDVGPNLIQLAAEGIYHQGNGLIVALHGYSVLELVIHDGERSLQAL